MSSRLRNRAARPKIKYKGRLRSMKSAAKTGVGRPRRPFRETILEIIEITELKHRICPGQSKPMRALAEAIFALEQPGMMMGMADEDRIRRRLSRLNIGM